MVFPLGKHRKWSGGHFDILFWAKASRAFKEGPLGQGTQKKSRRDKTLSSLLGGFVPPPKKKKGLGGGGGRFDVQRME